MGIPSITYPRAKIFFAKNGYFLEKEFLSKEVIGRKVELDEVTEPSVKLENIPAQKDVPMMPTPTIEEENDDDHETSNQATTELRRSTRTCTTRERYRNPVLEVILLDNDEPTNYEDAMMRWYPEKWLEAMKFEINPCMKTQV